jgi:hypothetical protein
MAIYDNKTKGSAVTAVEFSPVAQGNFAFFYLDDYRHLDEVKSWLSNEQFKQQIVAESAVNGRPVIITRGEHTQEALRALLESRGDKLSLHRPEQQFNYWAMRGGMSVVGQTLQLTSSLMGVEKLTDKHALVNAESKLFNPALAQELKEAKGLKKDLFVRKNFNYDIGVFAILNLIANGANILYGGQSEKDDNRLRHVKQGINDGLAGKLNDGQQMIDVNDNRQAQRSEPEKPPTIVEQFNEFARRHSVRFFELGLRFAAAVALVLPVNKMKGGFDLLKKGEVSNAFHSSLNPDKLARWAGIGYLSGKTVALFAKVPDPYDPKPHSTIDTIREKVLFKLGSVIEAFAGGTIAVNAYQKKKVGFSNGKTASMTPQRDWFGTVGGGLFATGYVVRLGAEFGSKNINMNEVYAHAEDTLARTPHDRLPQLLADTAAGLTTHFQDKGMTFGETYSRMLSDLYRYNQVAIENAAHVSSSEPKLAKAETKTDAAAPEVKAEPKVEAKTEAPAIKEVAAKDVAEAAPAPAKEAAKDDVQENGRFASAITPKKPLENIPAPLAEHTQELARAAELQQSQAAGLSA